MSWPQRAGGAAPAHPQRPQPSLQQGYNNQQSMYPNYQGGQPPAGNTQQYWQTQQPQYSQQYGQVYQQDYGNNANQFYPQGQYNQNYSNQGYTDTQQQYPQNYYQNQGAQQPGFQAQPNADSWEDNWDWGWDEASKQAQQAAGQHQAAVLPAQPPQPQVYNNANVIEESFASTDTWNWSTEDKKGPHEAPPAPKQEHAAVPAEKPAENKPASESVPPRSASNASSHTPVEEVRTLSDREVVKERLPNLALGKRFQLENLTPQWSIESQMSQESSDGPQTHSEGTNRSDNQSRNSSKSSPGVNTENSNFNYSQSAIEDYTPSTEWSRHSNEDTLVDPTHRGSRRESHDELTNSMQEMNIANTENPAPEHPKHKETVNTIPPSISPANLPPPMSSYMPPPTMPVVTMPPAPPVTTGAGQPPQPSSAMLPPPTNYPQTSSTNPFKQSGPFSHKKATAASSSIQSFPPTSNLTSPNAVNKVSQNRIPVGFGANLETTPDNSERPDQPQMSAFRPPPVPQQVPDNMEIAPQNDRNEYLQTAHLSSGDYGENTDFSRNVPPPGLRRMVVGQQETEYTQNLNISGDEPPPGLARMVPGQQTEGDNSYSQPDNYMERHIDGQPTDGSGRPYRQADGQQTPDNYSQPPPNRGTDRRPIGLDRMVPGEPSNDEYQQYQGSNYSTNEQRVVTGVDHDYPMPIDAGPSDIREQNVDGSDYSEQTPRTNQRNVIGAREVNDNTQDFTPPEEQQREVTMEGENLQDLSIITAADMTYSREQPFDGADMTVTDVGADRKTDLSDSIEHPTTSSRRQSINRGNTSGDESERDRAFKQSPRRDRDKHKSSRDRDRNRDRDKDRAYSRSDRKFDREREERRSGRDKERSERERERDWDRERRDREESPHSRRHRRSARPPRRYDTEDTDYYSDRERDRRAYREGSYASRPPRPEESSRRHERSSRYHTSERERRSERGERPRLREDRYEARYRDIDPSRKHGNLRAERDDDDRRRGEQYSSRAGSREGKGAGGGGGGTDKEPPLATDPPRHHRRARHAPPEHYYDGYAGVGAEGYGDAYLLQRQQYEYYSRLRVTDPHAYLHIYKQVLAGRAPPLPPVPPHLNNAVYSPVYGAGYETRADDRGSVHSGRSSANGLKGNDTYYGSGLLGAHHSSRLETSSLRDAPSLRTDLSDRELNTDASLNLHLEESTVRSERMTPCKFSTAHIKGSISSRNIVVVRPSYPVDGLPATVHIMSLAAALARDPQAAELAAYPGPLVKGVTHKMSVIEYCASRVRGAARAAPRDVVGYVLVWELLALLLRQNGVVVGTDIAELLMKNTREYEHRAAASKNSTQNESRRGSSLSGREDERAWSPEQPSLTTSDLTPLDETSSPSQQPADGKAALDKLREYLTYGNRQEALEWAMSCGLWGHAMQLASSMERRARAAVSARFLQAVPRTDPLHTLYSHLQARQPPAATCVTDERWGDWRPHAAIMLSNNSAKPDQDRRTLTQLGDSLLSRGLLYSAQFCYVSAGVGFSRHPLAPLQGAQGEAGAGGGGAGAGNTAQPRLALLTGDARATTLAQLATNQAIFATEIYEYALSLNQDYVITELQVYKLLLAARLVDVGQYERALGYVEAAARGVTRAPRLHSARLVRTLAALADRLHVHDPALADPLPPPPPHPHNDEYDSSDASPRHHQWLHDVKHVADMLTAEESQQSTPQHAQYAPSPQQQTWGDQSDPLQQHQQTQYQQPQSHPEPEEPPDYSQYYQHQPTGGATDLPAPAPAPAPALAPAPAPPYEEWGRQEEHTQQQAYDNYWQGDGMYSYGEPASAATGEAEAPRPMITMPGATRSQQQSLYTDYDGGDRSPSPEHQDDSQQPPKSAQPKSQKADKPKDEAGKQSAGSGWFGGILNKLSLRAPNQMILPDDKNPTIVWDAEKKRWRNLDGEEEGGPGAPPPPRPPTLQDLHAHAQNPPAPPAAGAPPPAPVSNIFKMQKGRHIKKSYVDVFNPSGAAPRPLPPAAEVLGPPSAPAPAPPTAPGSTHPNYFIPHQPALTQSGYYDPSTQETDDDSIMRSGI